MREYVVNRPTLIHPMEAGTMDDRCSKSGYSSEVVENSSEVVETLALAKTRRW
jgi:hypothetical protein